MLTLYGRPNSSNSAKVFWLLDELGADWRLEPAGRGFGPTDTPEFRAMNPFGKVPVLKDGETVLWESHAILRYLGAREPTPLWPEGAAARSRIDRWMDWAAISFTPPLTRLRKARGAGASGEADLSAVLAGARALDGWLARHRYLAGCDLSLADIAASPSVHRWFRLPEAAEALPNLARYRDDLARNPSYCRHIRDALS
ncbi:Glutathione S-transferase [Rhodobacter sp. AKP1]|nr:Glutathione S-transferase [Rhodobacter sp. AKP1]